MRSWNELKNEDPVLARGLKVGIGLSCCVAPLLIFWFLYGLLSGILVYIIAVLCVVIIVAFAALLNMWCAQVGNYIFFGKTDAEFNEYGFTFLDYYHKYLAQK